MEIIKINSEYYKPVLSGKKVTTIHKGKKDYELGSALLAFDKKDIEVYITAIMYTFYYLLKNHHAIEDGFSSLEDLKETLLNIYPDIQNNDYVTIVYFETM